MEKTIEVEIRGRLHKDQYEKMLAVLQEKGEFKTKKDRVLIDYSTYLPNEGIRERTRDIRLRCTNGIPEIIVKLGNWGGSERRKELSVLTAKGEFDKLVQIFAALGLTKGILCIRKSVVFMYKGIEFALVEVPNHSYYFEAEKMASETDDKEKTKLDILESLKKLGLTAFTDEEFFQYIELLNKEANEVFDFDVYTENYFKERFGI